jgi:hypothetical protein
VATTTRRGVAIASATPPSNEIDIWGDWPEAGIGIATGRVIGIDIDVLSDPHLAKRIEDLAREMLGDTPALRIGRAPKRLLVYRADQPFKGFKRPPIEVLGLGQQFVAYGLHPETGQPYDWPLESLAEIDIGRAAHDHRGAGARLRGRRDRAGAAGIAPGPVVRSGGATPARATRRAARHARGGARGARIHPERRISTTTAGCASVSRSRARSVRKAGRCSKPGPGERRRTTRETTIKAWQGLKPTRIGAGTLYQLALEAGWEPAPTLQLNGALVMNGAHPAKEMLQMP